MHYKGASPMSWAPEVDYCECICHSINRRWWRSWNVAPNGATSRPISFYSLNTKAIEVQNEPTTDNTNDTKDGVCASTAQNSVHQYTDPSLAKTSEYLKNLQEAQQVRIQKEEGSNSKVFDVAEANLAGNGLTW